MERVNTTRITIFLALQALRVVLLVLSSGIIAAFADCACQRNHDTILFTFSHFFLRSPGTKLCYGAYELCSYAP